LKSEILTKEGIINGFKNSLNQVQEKNESLTGLTNRLESEIAFTKKQLSNIRENIDKNKETFLLYSKSLSNTEIDLEKAIQVIIAIFFKFIIFIGHILIQKLYI